MNAFGKFMRRVNASITHGPPIEALTGKLNADGSVNQNPTDGLEHPYMWVRLNGSREETRVKNLATRDDWANVPVIVQRNRRTKEYEVVGLDPIKGPSYLGQAAATFNVPRRVGDVIDEVLPGRNFKPGRATASGLVVSVAPFPYTDSAGVRKQFPDDATIDNRTATITPPSSGLQYWAQPYLDPDATTPAIGIAYGDTFSLALPETTKRPQDIVLDSTYIPLDAVLVKAGDTTLPESRWRYMRQFMVAGSSGTDANAIHDNVAGEIAAVTAKATPIAGDLLLIEDSADSNNKKSIEIGDLPFGTGIVESVVGGTNVSVDSTDPTSPIINATSTPGGGAAPSICEGRLTLTSATPILTANVTAAGTLYWSPTGGYVGLYTGAAWSVGLVSEKNTSLAGLLPYSLHDVFMDYNAGTPVLALNAWTAGATGPISNATNATPIVITDVAHGLATGDIVSISGVGGNTAANGEFRITVLTADTFSLQTLAGVNVAGSGAYTSGGTWYKGNYTGSRATALTTQNGIYVLTGATDWRYLGTIRITATAGQCEMVFTSSGMSIGVWNYYNRIAFEGFTQETTNTWSYNTATIRPMNNNYANRIKYVCGVSEAVVSVTAIGQAATATSGNGAHTGVGVNSISADSSQLRAGAIFNLAQIPLVATYDGYPGAGGHYLQALEDGPGSGTITWYGDNGGVYLQSGIKARIWA